MSLLLRLLHRMRQSIRYRPERRYMRGGPQETR
jgi:hypothetical protein